MSKTKIVVAYSAGVVTAPLWFYIFKKPIAKHILIPVLGDESMNESLYKFMMIRNDYIDHMKKEAE